MKTRVIIEYDLPAAHQIDDLKRDNRSAEENSASLTPKTDLRAAE